MESLKDKKCIFAGSFDPVTLGHIDIVGKALMMFNEIVVAIGVNDKKTYTYSREVRLLMLQRALKKFTQVKVVCFDGMLADYMREQNIEYLIRGIRDEKDFAYEKESFDFNIKLNDNIKTLFVAPNKEYKNISSTFVKELIKQGKNPNKYLPYEILDLI